MKSREEIEAKLSDYKKEYEYLKEWNEKAYQKYLDNKKYWGSDADRAEYNISGDYLVECIKKIKLLSWVLNIETQENDGTE
jgi:hypothetical protein